MWSCARMTAQGEAVLSQWSCGCAASLSSPHREALIQSACTHDVCEVLGPGVTFFNETMDVNSIMNGSPNSLFLWPVTSRTVLRNRVSSIQNVWPLTLSESDTKQYVSFPYLPHQSTVNGADSTVTYWALPIRGDWRCVEIAGSGRERR